MSSDKIAPASSRAESTATKTTRSPYAPVASFHAYNDSEVGRADRAFDKRWEKKHGSLRDEWYEKLKSPGMPLSNFKDTLPPPLPADLTDEDLTLELAKPSRWAHIAPDEMFQTGNFSLNHKQNRSIWEMFAEGDTEKKMETASGLKNVHNKLGTLRKRFLEAKADGTFDWLDELHTDWESMAAISALRNDQIGMKNLESAFSWSLPSRTPSRIIFISAFNHKKELVETTRIEFPLSSVDPEDEKRLINKYGLHWANCHSLAKHFKMSPERTRQLEANGAKQKAKPSNPKPTTSASSIV